MSESTYNGFRADSQIGKLIDYIRDEYRAKYTCDYKLVRTGKNQFKAIAGRSSYGVDIIVEESKNFDTTVTK